MSKIKVPIFSKTSNRVYLWCIFVACCIVLLYLYVTPLQQEPIKYIETNKYDSLHINQTSPLIDEKPVIEPIVTTKACDPAYLILHHNFGVYLHFQEHGFNLDCSIKEQKKCGMKICTRRQVKKHSCPSLCKKYNHSNEQNSLFCNGGKIIWQENQFTHTFHQRLDSKPHLNSILKQYCKKYNNGCNFHLLAFDMSIESERTEFLSKHIDCNNDNPQYDHTWVFKEKKHRGRGIHIYNNHQSIYRLIVNSSAENIKDCQFNPIKDEQFLIKEGFNYHKINEGYVVDRAGLLMQTFIANPLLIQDKYDASIKHVFHVRSYFLIASYANPFVVLHWPKFALFVNPNPYNNKEEMTKTATVTNRHINDTHQFVDESWEWMMGPGEFERYLNQTNVNYTINKFEADAFHMLQEVFKANSYSIDNNIGMNVEGNDVYFDNGCMDIYINDHFELKLLEINMATCGVFCNKTKIARKVEQGGIYDWDCEGWRNEGTEILLEIFAKKSNNEIIDEIISLNQYQIALWNK